MVMRNREKLERGPRRARLRQSCRRRRISSSPAIEKRGGAELAAALRERAVLVRHFAKPARIAPYLRITVGSEGEIARLLSALASILGERGSR